MSAQDYPVTFPYGATSAPYSPSHPHRGDDMPTPLGTQVLVGNAVVGLTGSTGQSTGPHLHVQQWSGNAANTRKPVDKWKPGTVIAADSNPNQSWGKHVTVKNDDGWNTTYAHLSEVKVTVGQVIQGDDMATLQRGDVTAIWQCFMRTDPTEDDYKFAIGQTWDVYMKIIMGNPYATIQKSDVDNIWSKWMKTKPQQGDYDYGQGKNYGKYLYDVMSNPHSISVSDDLPPSVVVDGVNYIPETKK